MTGFAPQPRPTLPVLAANRDVDTYAVLAPAVEGFPPTRQFPELAEAQTLLVTLNS